MMFTSSIIGRWLEAVDCCPWGATTGRHVFPVSHDAAPVRRPAPLYTAEERRRRDASPWTLVQGVLAPVQFAVFLLSLTLVLRYLATGSGFGMATFSIIVKTGVLYSIMITGAIWEREVFGRYLFAPAFFWEDVFSLLVIALHTAYLAVLLTGAADRGEQMLIALAAYAAYAVNAAQFLRKFRAARLAAWPSHADCAAEPRG